MSKLLNDIKLSYGNAHALYRLMVINIAVFLVIMLARTILFLFQLPTDFIALAVNKLSLPSDFAHFITQPWSFITYMFLHQEFFHILFNMLVLYWLGKLFTEYLGNDRLWATFILGGMSGAVLYVLAYNLFPAFAGTGARLLGASAGVIAVMVAMATLLPDYTVYLMFFGPVKLKYIAIFSILLYAISIPDGNAGGNIAHLGGALFGFIMVKQLRKGNDMTAWLVKLFSRTAKPKMKVVSSKRRQAASEEEYNAAKKNRQETIDHILDKISQSGYSSLSAEEKEILFKASKNS